MGGGQGVIEDGNSMGNYSQARDHREANQRHTAHHMPGVQPHPAQQGGPVPERHVQERRGAVELLALWTQGRGVV